MKKLITLFLSLASALAASAQTSPDDYYLPSKSKIPVTKNISTSFTAGTAIGLFNQNANSAYATFIAPKISYRIMPKLNLNMGLLHYAMTGNTFMAINQHEALFNPGSTTSSGNLLLMQGEYQLNDHLRMSGTMLFDANTPAISKRTNYRATSLAVEYKITEHSSIQFQTIISQDQGNYYTHSNFFPANKFNSFEPGFFNGMSNSWIR